MCVTRLAFVKIKGAKVMRLRRLLLDDAERFVSLVSLKPHRGPHGLEWITMRLERGNRRYTATLIWNKARFLGVFK